ncbi:MAG: T9SS type A sorting domain-containing protein [Gemmatimonadetes bacterium]|nr:T9SS type A sorting domain-containing protein [Gemmatimonadota bacterium]
MNLRALVFIAALAAVLVPRVACAQQTIAYEYDEIGRLTRAIYDDTLSITYDYDDSGNIVSIVVGPIVVGVDDEETAGLPRVFALRKSRPNPHRGSSLISYDLPRSVDVRLEVFEISGRRVRSLVDKERPAGFHTAVWDGSDEDGRPVASGTYLYRLRAGDFTATRKLTVLR